MDTIDVTQMRAQQKGTIIEIQGGQGLIRRLEAMGVRPGVQITKMSGQLMQGPVVIKIGSTQVALGFGMARKIRVVPFPANTLSGF
ncbi:ferrous iron transport protein A [candidate division WOR-3 bacterium]|nr:ferrous iron transport protein A [candidate division WOR-3 bacterium]